MEELTEVRAEHWFNKIALHKYLKENLAEYFGNEGRLTVLQYRFVQVTMFATHKLTLCYQKMFEPRRLCHTLLLSKVQNSKRLCITDRTLRIIVQQVINTFTELLIV